MLLAWRGFDGQNGLGQWVAEVCCGHAVRLAREHGNQIHFPAAEEQQRWMEAARSLDGEWVAEVEGKGYRDGAGLLREARQRVNQYSGQAAR